MGAAVERLKAYQAAGADCLFAPGVADRETIGRLVNALGAPLNILATAGSPSIPEMKALGVARVSFGGGTWRVALGATRRFVREIRQSGSFPMIETEAIPHTETQKLLRRE